MVKKWLLALTSTIILSSTLISAAQTKNEPMLGSAFFHFPTQSVGSLSLVKAVESNPDNFVLDEYSFGGAKAVGNVRMPIFANTLVCLTLSSDVLKNPARLEAISPAGIQCLKLGLLSMTDDEVESTDKCLAKIGKFKEVRYLFAESTDASDEGMKIVESLPELRGIDITATRVKGACFKNFAKLPNLKQLVAQRCGFDESNFKYLSQCPKLEKIELRWSNISSKGLKLLAPSKSLKTVILTKESHIDDSAAAILATMPQLTGIAFNDTVAITNRSVESLSVLKHLRSLGLHHTKVDNRCIPSLKKLTNLEVLDAQNTGITEEGLLQLKGLNLKMLVLSDDQFKPGCRKRLSQVFPKLKWQPRTVQNSIEDDIKLLMPN